MSVDIIRGATRKPGSSRMLADAIAGQRNLSGQLFIGYPTIATSEGPHSIDALLISRDKGVIIFDLIEGPTISGYQDRQDDSANKLEARLRIRRELMKGRRLLIPIHVISFAPGATLQEGTYSRDYPIANTGNLIEKLDGFEWENANDVIYQSSLSAIEGISTIRKNPTRRNIEQINSRGAKLRELENSIATLDPRQGKAVIETVEGVQRIRGLAGSGKTIILALKAAYLHINHPEWRIAVTFNTRSLKGQFQKLIRGFCIEQGRDADDEKLRIVNAWGAPGGADRDGIYHEFCRQNNVEYLDFRTAKAHFATGKEFAKVCEKALGEVENIKQIYDVILVDEAQDFSPAFLRLCYEFLKKEKRLIYAYDELQNLSGESLPSPEIIFGKSGDGTYKVQFNDENGDDARNDIILEKCYRNSRPVLATAHALGFGIYRESVDQNRQPRLRRRPPKAQHRQLDVLPRQRHTNLVQMFEHSQLWKEIGYRSENGEIREGESVTLSRTDKTSPLFLEKHSDIDDLIRFEVFNGEEDQTEWLINEIRENLEVDELRHDDIVVINPDPLSTRKKVGRIRSRLWEMKINSHLAGVDTDPDTFFKDASVAFTGIYRAKGNETGMIYIINAHDCNSAASNLASIRNRIFTAITRSKAWVRVLGIGSGMKALKDEYEKLKHKEFKLHFVYPDEDQRKRLQIVHRDMTGAERNQLQKRQKSLGELIKDLEAGTIRPEDLGDDLMKLKELLGN